jgi:hypothetical protein
LSNIALSKYAYIQRKTEFLSCIEKSISTNEIYINSNNESCHAESDNQFVNVQENSQFTYTNDDLLLSQSSNAQSSKMQELQNKASLLIRKRQFDCSIINCKCLLCGNSIVNATSSRERDILQIGKNDHNYRNKKVREWILAFKWQLALLNQTFIHVMIVYFILYPQEFVEIAQHWISVAANRERMRNLTMEYSDFLSTEMLLYVKDRILQNQ